MVACGGGGWGWVTEGQTPEAESLVTRLSRRVSALPSYPLAEIPTIKRRLLQQGVDVIDIGAGDADFAPPAVAVEALARAVRDPAMSRYGFQLGLPAFREAAAAYMQRRFSLRFEPFTELHPLIGSKEGIAHLAMAVLDPGDVAIVPEPGYAVYHGGTVLALGTPHLVPLTPRTDFLLELEELPREVVRGARLVYLNYPNNPTAAVAPRDYLERAVAFCRRHDLVLAYDNPYCEITFDGYVAPSIFEIDGAREVAVEFHSLSKSFSMTGWRLGWAAGRKELIGALARVKNYVDTGTFLAVQAAGAAVLERAEELVRGTVERFRERRDAMVAALGAEGFETAPPRATMYLWIPLPDGLPSATFQRRALEDVGVVILPGTGFGAGAEGFFRVALTVPTPRLVEAAQRLGRVLAAV
jgi:LL-diaminopimelate aminotransferase